MALITMKEGIERYRLCTLKSALKLEIAGMKRSRNQISAYSIVKEEFGFKGNKRKVLQQLEDKLKSK